MKKTISCLVLFIFLINSLYSETKTTAANGRLCNQIFRNICVSFIAQKHNLLVSYSSSKAIQSLGIDLYVGRNNYNNTIKLDDNNFFELLNRKSLKSNLNPNSSYFQTKEISNYIFDYLQKEKIKQKIMLVNPFRDRYNNNNDCFIHIRLKDAEQWNPGIDYYLKAISQITFDKLYIASDDLNHVMIKKMIKKYPKAVLVGKDEVNAIQFGSTCRHIILSHGSFSAIVGYLSFFSNVYYKKYDQKKIWYGDMFSIPYWNIIL